LDSVSKIEEGRVEKSGVDQRLPSRDLPTSGRPAGPPVRPAPEATWDLAWRYGRDVARLLMVDPEKLFFFWEVTDETARRSVGRKGKLSARLLRLDGGERSVGVAEGVFSVMNWYWEVEPQARYRAEVGWLGPEGFESWLTSNAIATPRLSTNVTGEVVWRAGGRKKPSTHTSPRDQGLLGPDEHPSERPGDAASAARARHRHALREISRQAWSGMTAAWSRTAIPPRKDDR
jgi:hypothetical protein